MADKTSYIRLDRNIINWKWWHDHNTLIIFLFLLIKANIHDNGFSGQTIKRGQVVTSYQTLCNSTGLTIQQCRTAISHLKSTGEITSKAYSKFQVITIVNYDKYQDLTGKTPYKQQATNRQSTGNQQHIENKENKENKRRNKGRSAPGSPPATETVNPERGTDGFRSKSHLLLKANEGTLDDIPELYKGQFKTFAEYWRYRNQ